MVCGLISAESGVIHMEVRSKTATFRAFKAIDVVGILEVLRATYPLKKMALFLDNASIHKANIMKEASEKYQVPLVFNMAYCPQYNGIEQYWGHCKRHYRAAVGQLKVDDVNGWNNQDVVLGAIEKVSD